MKITDFIGSIFKPLSELVDAVHTSTEEKLELKNKMFEAQISVAIQAMEYERQILQSKKEIVLAEAQHGNLLQRSWRPITMLTFLTLVVADQMGWLTFRLAEEAWTLLQIGMGGYVVGRSVEKIAPKLKDVFGNENPK